MIGNIVKIKLDLISLGELKSPISHQFNLKINAIISKITLRRTNRDPNLTTRSLGLKRGAVGNILHAGILIGISAPESHVNISISAQ